MVISSNKKTTSTEKTVIVKMEGGANPYGNKGKNRKRSLSQPGEESVAKISKLEKFSGTASLDGDMKEKAGKRNRSGRRSQQTTEKKKFTAKSKKQDLKAKVLRGDIEAQRAIQAKLDTLIVKPAAERSKSASRKIRQLQSLLKLKSKVTADSVKQLTVAEMVQKASHKKKQGPKVQTQQVIKTEALQKEYEEPQSDVDSNKSNESDFEMRFAESSVEDGCDEEETDIDEEDFDFDEDLDIEEEKKEQSPKVQTQQVMKTEALQKEKKGPQSDNDADYEESSDESDFEMLFAENSAEEDCDEEDSDIDEEDSDIDEENSDIDEDDSDIGEDNSENDEEDNSNVVVIEKSQKQNKVNKV